MTTELRTCDHTFDRSVLPYVGSACLPMWHLIEQYDSTSFAAAYSRIFAEVIEGFFFQRRETEILPTQFLTASNDRLMGAFHLYYGGGPEGPAGTGKTESTKERCPRNTKCIFPCFHVFPRGSTFPHIFLFFHIFPGYSCCMADAVCQRCTKIEHPQDLAKAVAVQCVVDASALSLLGTGRLDLLALNLPFARSSTAQMVLTMSYRTWLWD